MAPHVYRLTFMKALIAILILVCVGLGAGLLYRHNNAQKQAKQDEETITQLTTKATETEKKLAEQNAVNTVLDKDLATRRKESSLSPRRIVRTFWIQRCCVPVALIGKSLLIYPMFAAAKQFLRCIPRM